MDYFFCKSLRLLNKKEYDYVFQSAKKIGTRFFTVLYRENKHNHPRLGLIVAKKTAKQAVERNRFKRIVRESFRLKANELPQLDIVILSRNGFKEENNSVLFSELSYIWKKIKINVKKDFISS